LIKPLETGKLYQPSAFYIGAQIYSFEPIFELFEATPYSLKLMEECSEFFSEVKLSKVNQILSAEVKEYDSNLNKVFESQDSDHSCVIPVATATSVLEGFSTKLTKYAILTLVRSFESGSKFNYCSLLSIGKS
jgi:hypothetical protein